MQDHRLLSSRRTRNCHLTPQSDPKKKLDTIRKARLSIQHIRVDMLKGSCADRAKYRCSLSLASACIRIAADPAARSVFLSLWSVYLASSAFFSLLAESVRAKRARRVESLPFLLNVSLHVGTRPFRPTGRCIAFQLTAC